MANICLVIIAFMLAAVATTNGGQVFSASKPTTEIPKIKGRLLTPQEGCGYSKVSTPRIVGGAAAKNGAYPWIALLGYRRSVEDSKGYFISFKQSFDCDGSLITSKHVLSAAHCIDDDLILVRLGEYDMSRTTDGAHEDVSVDHVVKHDTFDFVNMINDIALIHLVHDVDFTDRIIPVCLPIDGDIAQREFVGSNAFVAGWGAVSKSHAKTPILMQLQVPVIEMKECQKEYRKRKESDCESDAKVVFDEHVFCAGYLGGKGAYHGDSGGPLMIPVHENGSFPFYQIGIVSGSDSCVKSGFFTIFQRIQFYADWIHENLKAKNSTESI